MKRSLFIICAACLSACMTTRTNVGSYKESLGTVYTYSKCKQLYVFGAIRIGHTDANTPASGSCQVKTSINAGDALISLFTCGIIRSQTVKVLAKK